MDSPRLLVDGNGATKMTVSHRLTQAIGGGQLGLAQDLPDRASCESLIDGVEACLFVPCTQDRPTTSCFT
jgi:hypothetical protein